MHVYAASQVPFSRNEEDRVEMSHLAEMKKTEWKFGRSEEDRAEIYHHVAQPDL